MATVLETIGTRRFIDCVEMVTSACGESRPSTLLAPTDRLFRAMRAVNNACDRILAMGEWPFKSQDYNLELTADTMWYELPSDFDSMRAAPRYNKAMPPLKYVNLEMLYAQYPNLRAMEPGANEDLTTVTQHTANTEHFGTPFQYALAAGSDTSYIGLFYVPDDDFVTENVSVMLTYWREMAEMQEDGDTLPLPKYLWYPHYLLSLAEYKQSIEYSDFQVDLGNGERLLREQMAVHGLLNRRVEETITDINYNE